MTKLILLNTIFIILDDTTLLCIILCTLYKRSTAYDVRKSKVSKTNGNTKHFPWSKSLVFKCHALDHYSIQVWKCVVKWTWIHVGVFYDNLVVLINGYLTQEVSIQWGLKQGDHFSPFFFLLVVEGLSGLFSRAMELQLFSGICVGSSDLVVSYLQYADDIIILGETSISNL